MRHTNCQSDSKPTLGKNILLSISVFKQIKINYTYIIMIQGSRQFFPNSQIKDPTGGEEKEYGRVKEMKKGREKGRK